MGGPESEEQRPAEAIYLDKGANLREGRRGQKEDFPLHNRQLELRVKICSLHALGSVCVTDQVIVKRFPQ